MRGERGVTNRGGGGRSEPISVLDSESVDVSRLGTFTPDVEATMKQAIEDPNRLSGRSLMELVRQIFTRVVESQKMAETAARFCISIIERERKETFLESLLNNCQEWYHERDHLLRSDSKSGRWSAFMSFLNECLFLVPTHIGRDLMVEAPGQMTLILSCLREAFLMADAPQQV